MPLTGRQDGEGPTPEYRKGCVSSPPTDQTVLPAFTPLAVSRFHCVISLANGRGRTRKISGTKKLLRQDVRAGGRAAFLVLTSSGGKLRRQELLA